MPLNTIKVGTFLLNPGGTRQVPQKWLLPLTWVDVPATLPGSPTLNNGAHVYINVISGRHAGHNGYVLPAVFTHVPPPPLLLPNPTPFYGMVTQSGNVWSGRCPACDEVPALHVLPETPTVRQAIVAISNTITAQMVGLAPTYNNDPIVTRIRNGTAFMLGALAVRGAPTLYIGHSTKQNSSFIQNVVLPASGVANTVYAPRLPGGAVILNRQRLPAHNGSGQPYVQQFDYQCAAPRIIQAALNANHYPVAMSEIYHGGVSHQQTILSCGRCRQTVPYMLCPE